ncbi:hypothetical protein DIPPA_22738 [Diplonema papillatum]|nr:hypothetical protein DIPPA_22738 [Diplonema papillatum]
MEEVIVKAATAALLRVSPTGGGLEVLLAQAPFDNYLRAERGEKPPLFRYPGEFRIPGGCVDEEDGGDPLVTALRELKEELDLSHPEMKARLYSVRRTAVVKNRRYLMHNFVVHPSENPWVQDVSEADINAWLARKRQQFDELLVSGDYWDLTPEQKMEVAPEVAEAKWWPVDDACRVLACSRGESGFGFPEPHATELFAKYGLTQKVVTQGWRDFRQVVTGGDVSKAAAEPEGLFWNQYQRDSMVDHRILARDPMYQTLAAVEGMLALQGDVDLDVVCSHEEVLKRSNVASW